MTKNFCTEHQTVWFKKGQMKGFAHPIKDADGVTTGWCNRPEDYEEPTDKHSTCNHSINTYAKCNPRIFRPRNRFAI